MLNGAASSGSATVRATALVRPQALAFADSRGGAGSNGENTPAMVSADPEAESANELERPRREEPHGAFGNDAFGRLAEKAARFFGTPQYVGGQTIAVLAWVVVNST